MNKLIHSFVRLIWNLIKNRKHVELVQTWSTLHHFISIFIYGSAAFFGSLLKTLSRSAPAAHGTHSQIGIQTSEVDSRSLAVIPGKMCVWRDSPAQEAQTPRCSLWGWWLTENQPQEGEAKRHPDSDWCRESRRRGHKPREPANIQPGPLLSLSNCSHSTVQLSLPHGHGLQSLNRSSKAFIHKFNRSSLIKNNKNLIK